MKKLLLLILIIPFLSFGQTSCLDAVANATGLIGEFVPQCEEDGSYSPTQCWGSTGYCWCVDENGVEVPGTAIQIWVGDPDCSFVATCDPLYDCGPPLGMPNYLCNDSITIAGPGDCLMNEDGECVWEIIYCPEEIGCSDPEACNYDPEAVENNGSCTYPDMPLITLYNETLYGYDCDGNCLLPIEMCDCETVETDTVFFIEGCCGWPYPFPNCIYIGLVPYYNYVDCSITYVDDCCTDENGDGWCDGDSAGCTDPTACNYNAAAVQDNGSCEYDCNNCEDNEYWITEVLQQLPGFGWVSDCAEAEAAGIFPYGCSTYLFTEGVTFGQICGCSCSDCNDPSACNYNPDALNGSSFYCDYESCLCDTVYIEIPVVVTDTIVEIIEVIITEYLDCDTGLPCESGMGEIIEKSKTDGKLYNLLGQEIYRREGIYIEGGEVKYRLN